MSTKIKAILEFEKEAPKSHAFGIKTEDGILIKVWVPKSMMKKPVDELDVVLSIPTGGKKAAREEEDEDDDSDEEDDDESDDDSDDEDEDEEDPPAKKAKKPAKKRR